LGADPQVTEVPPTQRQLYDISIMLPVAIALSNAGQIPIGSGKIALFDVQYAGGIAWKNVEVQPG